MMCENVILYLHSVYESTYSTVQGQLDNRMQSAGSAAKGDIGTTPYRHVGAHWVSNKACL